MCSSDGSLATTSSAPIGQAYAASRCFGTLTCPGLRAAKYRGACLGVHYWPTESERGWREMHRQIDVIDGWCEADQGLRRIESPGQWRQALEQGRMALAPGVEGAHMLNRRLDRVEELEARHVAYMTLVHFGANFAASPGWGRGGNQSQGLSDGGRELVAALEESNILVDLAHVNTPGVLDACEVATKPVMCSHTGARALNDHDRLITDQEIDAIAQTGGVMGVIFGPYFLSGKLWDSSRCILDHVDYIAQRVGIDHVAIGTDFDGWMASIPNDMRDCRDLGVVTSGLTQRGYSEAQIEAICWGNALRVLSG